MITYKVTSLLLMAEPYQIMRKVFPTWDGQPSEYNQEYIFVTFDEPQQYVDLGDMFTVEIVDPNSPRTK